MGRGGCGQQANKTPTASNTSLDAAKEKNGTRTRARTTSTRREKLEEEKEEGGAETKSPGGVGTG